MSELCNTCADDKCIWSSGNVLGCPHYEPMTVTRYDAMFGTPEKAARTLEAMVLDTINWCNDDSGNHHACKACPYEYDYYGCYLPDGFSLLEWLKGEAE